MDSPSNYDYRRHGQFHAANPGYSLHGAEGSPHEQSGAPDEERPVHRRAYLEERPDRGSTSVDSSHPSEQEYCGFWSALSPFNLGSQGADEETSLLQRGHDSVRRQSRIPTIAPVATNTVCPACMAVHSIHFPDASLLLRELRFFCLALV